LCEAIDKAEESDANNLQTSFQASLLLRFKESPRDCREQVSVAVAE